MTQRFIEFVMMQAQNAALFLGQIPNPQTGKAEINLEVARMFIDQLAMIQEKTRGNLTTDETTVLRNALSSLQMAFVEASQGKGGEFPPESAEPMAEAETAAQGTTSSGPTDSIATPPPSAPPESESKKKFSKSYGA